jgi:hypothetical protein
MTPIVVCSFWVSRPREFPKAAPYLEMCRILDATCRRFGFEHVVLTDNLTAPQVCAAGLKAFAVELPRSLMKAATEIHARWLASPHSLGVDTIFTGADCIVRRDFRADLPDGCDVAIAYMKGHKKWRLNNGFVYVPAGSREKVAPLFRLVADDTGERICDDMLALERALVPMPADFGQYERRALAVEFLPLRVWNRYMATKKGALEDEALDANMLHFMGGWDDGKKLLFDWARRWMPSCLPS